MKPAMIEKSVWTALALSVGYSIGLDDAAVALWQNCFADMPSLGMASIGATLLVAGPSVRHWLSPSARKERQAIEDALKPLYNTMHGLDETLSDQALMHYAQSRSDLKEEHVLLTYAAEQFCDACRALSTYIEDRQKWFPEVERALFVNPLDASHHYPSLIARALVVIPDFYTQLSKYMIVEGIDRSELDASYHAFSAMMTQARGLDLESSRVIDDAYRH